MDKVSNFIKIRAGSILALVAEDLFTKFVVETRGKDLALLYGARSVIVKIFLEKLKSLEQVSNETNKNFMNGCFNLQLRDSSQQMWVIM